MKAKVSTATKSTAPSKQKATVGGRDSGLSKAKAATTAIKQGPKTPLERFNDNRTSETARLSRKHEMDHELRMENAKAKRYKYEFKYGAPTRTAEATLKIAELERQTRIEEMKLQLEILQLQRASTSGMSASMYASVPVSQNMTPLYPSSMSTDVPIPAGGSNMYVDSHDHTYGADSDHMFNFEHI